MITDERGALDAEAMRGMMEYKVPDFATCKNCTFFKDNIVRCHRFVELMSMAVSLNATCRFHRFVGEEEQKND